MRSFHRFAGQGSIQLALALVAVGSWVSGCGDDESSGGGGGKGKGGSSGTAGAAGAAGSVSGSGGSNAGSGGTAAGTGGAGGSGGMPVAGNAGSAGAAGSAGNGGMGGEPGGGGEGGMGDGGMAGTAGTAGMGGEGGSGDMMCTTGDLSFMEDSMQAHDHLPVVGMDRQTLLAMINTGAPLVFTMPEDGTNPHTHTVTFTAAQLTTLRNGGSVEIASSTGGPAANMHEHTFTIECAP